MLTPATLADAAGPALHILGEYLPPPVARALVATVARRTKGEGAELGPEDRGPFLAELERALAAHILDARRRMECTERLRNAAPAVPAPGPTPRPVGQEGTASKEGGPRETTTIRISRPDDVGIACDAGRDLSGQLGFSNVQKTKIATAIAELARNILLYAGTGEVRISTTRPPRTGIEVLAVDQGPGIADIEHVMSGAYRSRSGMGMGLRGAKRLMDTLEIESSPRGTSVLMRKYRQP